MCLYSAEKFNKKELIAFKVVAKRDGRYYPIFMVSLGTGDYWDGWVKNLTYQASCENWVQAFGYEPSFHAVTRKSVALSDIHRGLVNTVGFDRVVVKVKLIGNIFKDLGTPNVAGTKMMILEEV